MRRADRQESPAPGRIVAPVAARLPRPKVAEVSECDGVWMVSGSVVQGDKRGRLLGFPTANLNLEVDSEVRDGVWAAEVALADKIWVAVVSIGHRPTFYGRQGARLMEVHLLDFDGDLYDNRLDVVLREHFRPQRTFRTSVGLVRQMHADLAHVRDWARRQIETDSRRARRVAPETTAARTPERIIEARRSRRDRLIEAAAQDAESSGVLDHQSVASRAQIPLGFLEWAYPSVEDLRRASHRGAHAHRRS